MSRSLLNKCYPPATLPLTRPAPLSGEVQFDGLLAGLAKEVACTEGSAG